MGTLANSENPDKMSHDVPFAPGSTLFVKTKSIFRERKTTILIITIVNLTPQYIYQLYVKRAIW